MFDSVFADAHASGLIGGPSEVAVDSTGLSATVRSAHYARRRRRDGNRRYRYSRFPKLTIVCDTATHLVASPLSTVGPGYDCTLFEPALLRASWNLDIDRLLADSGYDAEANHVMARPPGAGHPLDGDRDQPPADPQVAEAEIPTADATPLPPPQVRPALAGRERHLPHQASPGLGTAGPQRPVACPGK